MSIARKYPGVAASQLRIGLRLKLSAAGGCPSMMTPVSIPMAPWEKGRLWLGSAFVAATTLATPLAVIVVLHLLERRPVVQR